MPISTTLDNHQFSREEPEVWESLKEAIASSSGFARWQLEQRTSEPPARESLDEQVRCYLRETLETLAY